MHKIAAIIVGAGSGRRMAFKTDKPFIKICGKPILSYSLDLFNKIKNIDLIVVAVSHLCRKRAENLIINCNYKKPVIVVEGGSTRARSVYNALRVIDDSFAAVLVHDAARPFVKKELVEKCIDTVAKKINCILAVPAKATIKNVNPKNLTIKSTPDRRNLYEAQTPQAFNKKELVYAYAHLKNKAWQATDDACLIEKCKGKIKVVEGDYFNIKITTKEDLKIAKNLARKR